MMNDEKLQTISSLSDVVFGCLVPGKTQPLELPDQNLSRIEDELRLREGAASSLDVCVALVLVCSQLTQQGCGDAANKLMLLLAHNYSEIKKIASASAQAGSGNADKVVFERFQAAVKNLEEAQTPSGLKPSHSSGVNLRRKR